MDPGVSVSFIFNRQNTQLLGLDLISPDLVKTGKEDKMTPRNERIFLFKKYSYYYIGKNDNKKGKTNILSIFMSKELK